MGPAPVWVGWARLGEGHREQRDQQGKPPGGSTTQLYGVPVPARMLVLNVIGVFDGSLNVNVTEFEFRTPGVLVPTVTNGFPVEVHDVLPPASVNVTPAMRPRITSTTPESVAPLLVSVTF